MSAAAPGVATLEGLARIFRSQVNRYAWWGLGIGLVASLVATLLHALVESGSVTLEHLLRAQSNNPALWLLDLMPLAFLLWGQAMGQAMAWRAGALVLDETQALREQTRHLSEALDRHEQRRETDDPRRRLTEALDTALTDPDTGQRVRLLLIASEELEALHGEGAEPLGLVLEQLRQRLAQVLDDRDRVFALADRRHAVILTRAADDPDGQRLAARLLRAFDTPLDLRGELFSLSLHIGLAHGPRHGATGEALLQAAEAALHLALASGKDAQLYDPALPDERHQRARLLADLYGALELDGLGMERVEQQAPARAHRLRLAPVWKHPRGGRLPPGRFMDLPTRPLLLHRLSVWQLEQAFATVAAEQALVLRPPARAWTGLAFAEIVLRLVEAHDRPASGLTLELPASLLAGLQPALLETLETLHRAGVRLGVAAQGLLGPVPAAFVMYPLSEARFSAAWLDEAVRRPRAETLLRQTLAQLRALDAQVTLSGVSSPIHQALALDLGADWLEGPALEPAVSP